MLRLCQERQTGAFLRLEGKEVLWIIRSLVPSTKSFADGSRKKIVGRIAVGG